jgi:hypothetical protein
MKLIALIGLSILLIGSLVVPVQARHAGALLFLDGLFGRFTWGTNCGAQRYCSLVFNTTHSRDLIIAFQVANSSLPGSAIRDSQHLKWNQRTSFTITGPCVHSSTGPCVATEWYAFAPRPLSNDNVTADFQTGGQSQIEALLVMPWANAGGFDTNPALPSTTTWTRPGPCQVALSTRNPDDAIIGFQAGSNGDPGSGFTNTGGPTDYLMTEYEIMNQRAVNLPVSFTNCPTGNSGLLAEAVCSLHSELSTSHCKGGSL